MVDKAVALWVIAVVARLAPGDGGAPIEGASRPGSKALSETPSGGDEAMMNGWDGTDWIWMTFMMIAFWGGLAAVVVFAIKGFGGSRRSSARR